MRPHTPSPIGSRRYAGPFPHRAVSTRAVRRGSRISATPPRPQVPSPMLTMDALNSPAFPAHYAPDTGLVPGRWESSMPRDRGRHRSPKNPSERERNGRLVFLLIQVAAWIAGRFTNQ